MIIYVRCIAMQFNLPNGARNLLMDCLRTSASKNWTESCQGPALEAAGLGSDQASCIHGQLAGANGRELRS